MYIKKIRIQNFKCFEDESIEFNIPISGEQASGLNILAGENNSGKSTLFSIFAKLREGSDIYSTEKRNGQDIRIEIMDSDNKNKIIKNIEGSSNINKDEVGDSNLKYGDIHLIKANKFWVGNAGSNKFTEENYKHHSHFIRNEIDRNLAMALAKIVDDPNMKLKFDSYIKQIFPNFRDWNTDADNADQGVYIKYKVSDSQYAKIDDAIGSGILSVFSIVYALIGSSPIIIIDEPESFLHPIAQKNLLKILEEESENKQIIFTTHSPFMFRGISSKARIISFTQDIHSGKSATKQIQSFVLQNGPTYGEIDYFVYNLATEEFHNELYGFTQAKAISLDARNEKSIDFDKFLETKGAAINMPWIHEKVSGDETYNVTLHTYIRNSIHHPENRKNNSYSEQQLIDSIKGLLGIYSNLSITP